MYMHMHMYMYMYMYMYIYIHIYICAFSFPWTFLTVDCLWLDALLHILFSISVVNSLSFSILQERFVFLLWVSVQCKAGQLAPRQGPSNWVAMFAPSSAAKCGRLLCVAPPPSTNHGQEGCWANVFYIIVVGSCVPWAIPTSCGSLYSVKALFAHRVSVWTHGGKVASRGHVSRLIMAFLRGACVAKLALLEIRWANDFGSSTLCSLDVRGGPFVITEVGGSLPENRQR